MTLYNNNSNNSNTNYDTKIINNLSSNHFINSNLLLHQQPNQSSSPNLSSDVNLAQYSNNINLEMIDNTNIVADQTIVCDDEQQTNETNVAHISNQTINNGNIYKTVTTNANNNYADDTVSHQQRTTIDTHCRLLSPPPPSPSAMLSNCDLNYNDCQNNNSSSAINNSPSSTLKQSRNPSSKTINEIQQQNLKKNSDLTTVHVVVGNEACDLDSAVSCLLMFHILTKMSDGINGKDKVNTLYIPLLNTTRDLLESKSEVLWFLKKTLNIDKSFLTCKDDIDWKEIKKSEYTNLY